MSEQTETRPADYWLGDGSAEQRRLINQAATYRAEAVELVDRLKLRPGSSAIDLGCGPIGILDLLTDRVGANGRVVGIDIEQRMLDLARRTLAERGISGVELIRADIAKTGLPAASFDLVHGRLVLLNNTDPREILREMTRIVRPGGWVAVQDLDKLAWACEPEHPSWDRLLAGFRAARAAEGYDEYIGRRLPRLLREGGLVDVDLSVHARVWSGRATTDKTKLVHFATVRREQILATGLITESQFDEDLGALREHLSAPDTVVINALLVQAWGRAPQ